jgi:hypothetical protein
MMGEDGLTRPTGLCMVLRVRGDNIVSQCQPEPGYADFELGPLLRTRS